MMFHSSNEAETREIGRRIGKKLRPGDVVCLYGDLGAGKTTMIKGIASVFGINERDITSASYTIIAEYDSAPPFYHIDLYRVNEDEVGELGLYECLGSEGIAVIEWAERAEEEIPDRRIKVVIHYRQENTRDIELQGIML